MRAYCRYTTPRPKNLKSSYACVLPVYYTPKNLVPGRTAGILRPRAVLYSTITGAWALCNSLDIIETCFYTSFSKRIRSLKGGNMEDHRDREQGAGNPTDQPGDRIAAAIEAM